MDIPFVPGFVRRLVAAVVDDEVPDLAAGLAYRFLFAIFPFAIFLAAMAAFIAPAVGIEDPTGELLGGLADNLPPDVAQQLRPQMEAVLGTARPGLVSIGAVTALWAAAGGIGAVISAMNKAYDVEETRGFLHRTAVALGLTILGSIGILAAFVTIVGGSILTETMVYALGIGDTVWAAISILRFPVVLLVVALGVAVLFKLGPNVSVSFRWTLAGGAVFALGWMLATVLFGIYVANFGSYANTYGALGGVVVLMLWFYLTGLLLLVAAEVTSLLAKEREPDVIEARRREVGARTARRAPTARSPWPVEGRATGLVAAARADGRATVDMEHAAATPGDPARVRAPHRASSGRARPGRPQGTTPPRPAPGAAGARGWSGLAAASVLAIGALAGVIAGRLASNDRDNGAR